MVNSGPTILLRNSSHRFVPDVVSTFLTQLISLSLSIASAAVVARWLGPGGKGVLALVLLVPGLLSLLLNGGISVANVYFAGSKRLNVPTLSSNSVGFAVFATITGMGVVGVLLATGWARDLVPGVPVLLILLGALGIPISLLTSYFGAILQGLQHILALNITNLCHSATTLMLTLVLVIGLGLGLLGGLLASMGAGVVTLGLLGLLLRREGAVFRPHWDLSIVRPTLSFGLRGHIGNVLQFFNYRLDLFIVNYLLGPTAVGIYSVSVGLAGVMWYLPNAVGFVIFPRAASTQREIMNQVTPHVFLATLGLTVVGALALAVLGKPLIQLIYSSVFVSAYMPMLALLPGVVLLGSGKVLTNEIAGRGYPHYNSINAGLALGLTVTLDLLLIPRYGVLGAAIASSIAYGSIFLTAIGFYLSVSRRSSKVAQFEVSTR